MTFLVPRGNNALGVNPPNADTHLTTNGSNWLWACTAVFGVAFLFWLVWTLRLRRTTTASTGCATAPGVDARSAEAAKHGHHGAAVNTTHRGERVFHYLLTTAAFVGLIAYFTMASDLGSTPVQQYMNTGFDDGSGMPTRQIFYARYIYWFVSWPLLLIAVLLLSGLSWATILFSMAVLEIWIVSWLSGALVHSSYRWGYFTFGLIAYLVLAYILLAWGVTSSRSLGSNKSYVLLAGLLVLVWVVYPISWGLSEGSNRLSVTGEMVFYSILDLISVPIYGTILLLLSRRFDHRSLFAFTQRGRISGREAPLTSSYGPTNDRHDIPAAVQSGV
jgi:bacteriorhodopsin